MMFDHIDYSALPDYMQGAMQRWIERGILPGDFLTAVLSNDLMGALGCADSTNVNRLKDYGSFLYNYAPPTCFGSPDRVRAWAKRGGLRGNESITKVAR